MPNELTPELIQTTLQLPTEQRGELARLLLDSLEGEQEQETSEVPGSFIDPATGEAYGIDDLRAKLAEGEADIAAGRISSVNLQQELNAALKRKATQQTMSDS